MDVSTLFEQALAYSKVSNVSNMRHFQILADGVRVFNSTMMTNVGVRAFEAGDLYNSMTAMKLL